MPDYFLCSYPKSGRTWVRFILANYFTLNFKLDVALDFHTLFSLLPNEGRAAGRGVRAFKYRNDQRIPLVLSSHRSWKRHFEKAPVIFILRSIADVLVSHYFHVSRQHHQYEGDIHSYIRDPELGLENLLAYLNSWAPHLSYHSHLVLTYERLGSDPMREMQLLLNYIGVPVDPVILREAITASSFDKMQEIEVESGIPGHDYDRADPSARRVRSGNVGGASRYLAPEDLVYIHHTSQKLLTPVSLRLIGREDLRP